LEFDKQQLFESNAIAEFLDEMVPPQLHPEDPVKRARNRAWTDYVPTFSPALGKITYCKSREAMDEDWPAVEKAVQPLETALTDERSEAGPYFNGSRLSLMDAAYAPFLQRFIRVDKFLKSGFLNSFPKLKAWAETLAFDPVVVAALSPEFDTAYKDNLKRREAFVATLLSEEDVV
ncbi:MAG: glutathione S-transferase family protein, partial [Methyloligellaceae bacterium]